MSPKARAGTAPDHAVLWCGKASMASALRFVAQLKDADAYNVKGNFEFQIIAGVTAELRTRSSRAADG
ncbi:hypothetical protein ACWEO4_18630 [Streptomyces sp. NPDC004393]